jgi:hypothetical protein
MSDPHDGPTRRRFTETEVREVLTRASELDALKHATLSLRQLRDIAGEVDISAESLDAAIAEMERAPAHPVATQADGPAAVRLPLVAALGGAAIGVVILGDVTWPSGPVSYDVHFPTGALLLGAACLAFISRGARAFRQFHIRNAGLWLGFGASQGVLLLAASGMGWPAGMLEVMVESSVTGWVMSSALGSAIVWVINRPVPEATASVDQGGDGGSTRPKKRRSVREWLNDVLFKARRRMDALPRAKVAANLIDAALLKQRVLGSI